MGFYLKNVFLVVFVFVVDFVKFGNNFRKIKLNLCLFCVKSRLYLTNQEVSYGFGYGKKKRDY